MKPTARLIVVESMIPEEPTFNFGNWTDLQMLVCVGGRERTETEYRALLAMNPHDLADVHYRLAKAYFAADDLPESREQLLYALEIAPHYREAQQLLLEIVR